MSKKPQGANFGGTATGRAVSRRRFGAIGLRWCALALGAGAVFDGRGQERTNGTARAAADFEPNLPLAFLEANGPIKLGQKTPVALRLRWPKGGPGETGPLPGTVRPHGASSLGFEKKSLGLYLESPLAPPGMRERTRWVLNAAFIDRSLMRHKLSYDLFASLSGPGGRRRAPASLFAELFLNGKYEGVYLLMERMDRALLGLRRYASPDAGHACIYKAVDHAARFDQEGHAGYEQHEPDPKTAEYWQPLDEFNRFASGAPDAAFFDPKTGIASRLDLGNAIDYHLLLLMTSNMDGATKNFIIARDAPGQGAAPLFFFAPWDFDATFGRNWNADPVPANAWLSNHLFDRLMDRPDYRKRFAARWREIRQNQFSVAAIVRRIDENANTLGEAAQRNAKRWPTTQWPYPDALSFEQDTAQMRRWIAERAAWLDEAIGAAGAR